MTSANCSHWQETFTAKPLKSRQVDGNKKSVMTEMRLLSKPCIAFSEADIGSNISAKYMFVRTNFHVLEATIEQVSLDFIEDHISYS